jgi:hypothetical protein
VTTPHHSGPPDKAVQSLARAGGMALLFVLVTLLVVPVPALAQGTSTQAPIATVSTPAPTTEASATPRPIASLKLSSSSGLPGATITANGSAFKPGETVEVTFNGQSVGSPTVNDGGSFSLSFSVPNVQPGQYGMLAKGAASGFTATAAFSINQGVAALSFSAPQAAPATSLTVTGTGFQPGETVQFWFNGAVVGSATADTKGSPAVTFVVPTLDAGAYDVTATGQTSNVTVTSSYTVLATAATPVANAAPTATPTPQPAAAPAPAPAPIVNAPAIVHDDRYFSQTGYRVDNDEVWSFFNQYGGITTFGYPTSRMMTFLGCPVQMFQRQIIQDCPGQGAALINMLDPEIFPYTQVNGSTFPGPDATLKNNTPPVGSPSYATDISSFVSQNVPDAFNGQPVNFLQTFNADGGLAIWGAPISNPASDPANSNFVYQRFQRGVMHYIAGTGTESILLADYLKAIIMNQNVPPDLLQQSRETRFFNQYCPGQPISLCRPDELPGTDLTFAFVTG